MILSRLGGVRVVALFMLFLGLVADQASGGMGDGRLMSGSLPERRAKFFSAGATEATLRFEAELRLTSAGKPSEAEIKSKAAGQLIYMIGPMRLSYTASALGLYDLQIESIERQAGAGSDRWVARYRYSGRVILSNSVGTGTYPVFLPYDPNAIYSKSFVDGRQACTRDQQPSADLFWYSWFPETSGCPLVAGRDYQKIAATFERMANTVRTYPEYGRMFSSDPAVRVVRTAVFYSKADKGTVISDPSTSTDWGARDYAEFRSRVVGLGYSARKWTESEIASVAPGGLSELPWVETFTKDFQGGRLEITAFFGETDLSHASKGFHYFWKRAVENDAVVLYSGHSGIGKNLHLGLIEKERGFKFKIPAEMYQMMMFGSCVSYSYYPRVYQARKATSQDPQGTRNLDMLANGTESTFGNNRASAFLFLGAVEDYLAGRYTWSYQQLVSQGMSKYLFSVVGDEDNP